VTTAKMNSEWRGRRHVLLNEQVDHHAPTPAAVVAHQTMRAAVAHLGHLAIDTCPLCPELEEALRTLTDEVLSGFNAAIARNHHQLTEGGA
jgi:hypothetical protein